MYLIVGLGNPGPEYSMTRHNMGFDVINKLSEEYNIEVNKDGFEAKFGIGTIENEKVILCKPQTFMNLSGDAISEIMKFYKISPDDVIIIYDDIDVDVGKIKIRKMGGPGSHNGMKSVVQCLNTKNFARIRIGTGEPEDKSKKIDYVIKKVSNEEYEKLKEGIQKGKNAICEILKNGIDIAMNKFN